MSSTKRHLLNSVIVFIISSFAVVLVFQEIITYLNSSLISNGGDGIKNYYTYLYQVQYGSGTHFQGMNYPYGEHVIFTDNMPLLVWLIQGIGQWIPGATHNALGIMHFLVFVSIPTGCVFMYKILTRFHIPAWLAGLCGIIIVLSCQQYMKIEGHFGMAFMGYIPMMLYWLMQYNERRKILYPVLFFIFTLLFAFFHLYNLAISTVLIVFYSLSFFIIHFKKSLLKNIFHILPLIISILAPTIIVKIFLSATDLITDRPDYPYGVFSGATEGKHIFLNPDAPMGNLFQFLFGPAEQAYGEGSIYLGLVSFGTFLFVLICSVAWLARQKKQGKTLLAEVYEGYSIWLLTGFFALLLGMGVPISWGWEALIDHIATIRQFRTVGRFSWIFYFIFQIFVVITLFRTYRYLVSKDKKILATVISVACITVSFTQSFAIYNFYRKNPDDKQEYFKAFAGLEKENSLPSALRSSGKPIQDFQAIIALPFFHVGSEKLWIGPAWNPALNASFHISYQTGLPIVNVMLSRTSWDQSFENVRLTDGPFSKKGILDRFSDKPLLILADTQYTTDIYELYLTTIADSLLTWNRFRIYSLSKSQLLASQREIVDSTSKIAYQSKEAAGIILPPGSDSFLYVHHFDEGTAEGKIGKGFYQEKFEQKLLLDMIPLPHLRYDHKLVINIWAKVNDYKYNGPAYIIDQFNADSQHVHHQNIGAKLSTLAEEGLWLLTEKAIDIHPQAAFMTIRIDDGKASNRNYMTLDELAIYPVSATYYYKKDGILYLNNRSIR